MCIVPVSDVHIRLLLSILKFRQNMYAEVIPLLKVKSFSPLGRLNILIIVPLRNYHLNTLHEHVASESPLLFKESFKTGDLCAFIETSKAR